jgi:hypothetical protein
MQFLYVSMLFLNVFEYSCSELACCELSERPIRYTLNAARCPYFNQNCG